ncbi:TraB/GumN family protein [Mesorhizobium sp. LHD-90]|uniref:TraB/GumN family protein n=1 Tax=Mesorhizobium sp. LHD-90 TaxID=3071414 RepID=UPI0027E00F17|nr:TraB/GumN family protein [Mesorhizobium sp. LHD-90]MDQ6437088.1 TraB/GumN family protein [Mesorhizobium sp. LHD-90]
MTRWIPFADRAALPLLKLLAAVNHLLLLAFALTLAVAVERANAESAACTGKDMLAELRHSDPTKYAAVEAEAAKVANGEGLLWKIEKADAQPSWLFGTMHVTDPRVTTLTSAAQAAYDASGTVVIETTEVLDQQKMMASIMQKPELMMFTDQTTLASLLPAGEADFVNKALEKRGIPPTSVAKMKPWVITTMLSLPACELQRKAGGAPVLDAKLAQDAIAGGKRLEGLETAVEQMEAMASLPIEFHIRGLIDTLKIGDRMDDVIETMVVLYTQGEIGTVWPLLRSVLPSGENDVMFEKAMITARNHTMAKRAGPIVDAGGAFIAVGAMHLPGPEGLVELLRKAGYTVSRAD